MILLLGASGILGQDLFEMFSSKSIIQVSRADVMNWTGSNGVFHLKSFLGELPKEPSLIINAVGITNPSAPYSDLKSVNFQLPANLVTAASGSKIKIVTFGSIMEAVPNISKNNNYLKSKMLFRDFLDSDIAIKTNFLHFQIHTLYGGTKLHEHMFLGQLLRSIRSKDLFHMTEGSQLREYHHMHDDLRAVAKLIDLDSIGIHQINHGDSFSLREIAEHVLGSFDASRLLRIGSLTASRTENFTFRFTRTANLQFIDFKPTLTGIVNDFEEKLGGRV